MFYELYRHQVRPGRRDEWVQLMETVVVPFQVAQGMVITALFNDAHDSDGFYWIRRFDSDTAAAALRAAVYDSDQWKHEIAPIVAQLLLDDQTTHTRLHPLALSVLQ